MTNAKTPSLLNDVRILTLPSAKVASIHRYNAEIPAEYKTNELLTEFVIRHDLIRRKPDIRHFGFNHPNGEKADGSDHGYERWITIPEDLDVTPPFTLKTMSGGLYAAHRIRMGRFDEWHALIRWVEQSPDYAIVWGDPASMGGLLEEHLDYVDQYRFTLAQIDQQTLLDLLIPVRHLQK